MRVIPIPQRASSTTAIVCLSLLGALASPPRAAAQGARASSPVELARRAEALRPGQWVWAPQIAPRGPTLIVVDLSQQIASVYRNGVRIGVSTVSSGKPGHETPTGVFTILEKDADHRSNLYHNAPMPYMERLTWGGVALHAGGLPGYPESHGCVHLPLAFSRLLFGATERGMTVVISGRAGGRVAVRRAGVLAGRQTSRSPATPRSDSAAAPAGGSYTWTPERSPSGPITLVISKADQQVVVMRNGVEIGRAWAQLPADATTHVLTLVSKRDGQAQWAYVGVPGHESEEGTPVDPVTVDRVRFPEQFRSAVLAILEPGTTVLVTAAPLSSASGRRLTVLASDSTRAPR